MAVILHTDGTTEEFRCKGREMEVGDINKAIFEGKARSFLSIPLTCKQNPWLFILRCDGSEKEEDNKLAANYVRLFADKTKATGREAAGANFPLKGKALLAEAQMDGGFA